MERLKLFIPLIVFLILFAAIMMRLLTNPTHDVPSALLDKPLPSFELPALSPALESQGEGDAAFLITNESLKGNPYLLNAWATWCAPCRIEHPTIVELSKTGIRIVGLNYKDEEQKALRWLEDLENPYEQVVFDKNGRLGLDLGITGIPETYFIDANGIIRYKHTGIIDEQVWADKLQVVWQDVLSR